MAPFYELYTGGAAAVVKGAKGFCFVGRGGCGAAGLAGAEAAGGAVGLITFDANVAAYLFFQRRADAHGAGFAVEDKGDGGGRYVELARHVVYGKLVSYLYLCSTYQR